MALHLVILDREQSPGSIAGVHPIARLVNSAWQAGIDEITVATELDARELTRIESTIPGFSRRRPFRVVRRHEPSETLENYASGDQLAVIDTGVLANAEFFSFLRNTQYDNRLPVRIRVPDYGSLFWSIPWSHSHLLSSVGLEHVSEHFSRLYPNGQIPEVVLPADSYVDVTDPRSVGHAEKWLVKQSVKATDGLVSRHLNRPISTRITRLLIPYDIKPVHFTAVVALGTVVMLGLLVTGNPVLLAAGCVLFHVLSVLDGTDGELARVRFESTDWGARLDTAVDMVTNLGFVIGLNIGLVRIYGVEYELFGQLLVLVVGLHIILMMLLVRFGPGGGSFDILIRAIEIRIQRFPRLQTLMPVALKLFKRDFYALVFAVLGALGLAKFIPWIILLGIAAMLTALVLNAPYILRARAEDILPQHILDH
jgi:phosphatidylglycerophosphate synthase